eukprot:TRINITY_DN8161_c0_g2_i1.p1 TRINITY_DN8161_c0_g2~~TRINITY_DN8161_c0_g2_i1.p1  ORF type:complete len:206 (+),score=56.39 TRINITY_DN8161_c0_g2_i1:470-1087(+)
MNHSILKSIAGLCLGAVLFLGCMGKPGPGESFLRLEFSGVPQCVLDGRTEGIRPIAIRDIACLPNLDRTAVMFAEGNVLQPSQAWYWEGAPSEILTQYLIGGLSCSRSFRVVWPYKPRVAHEAVLSGRVEAFEVRRTPSPSFRIVLYMDVWGPVAKEWMAGKSFTADVPMRSLTANGIAEAANTALVKVLDDILVWLDREVAPRS